MRVECKSHTDTLRQHGKSFYWASCFLGRKKALQAARLYAFCRTIDDLVDKTRDSKAAFMTLDLWRKQIQEGKSTVLPVKDILALAQEISLDTTSLDYLIEGLISDLTLQFVKDESQLLQYCFLVAGTVGIMMCNLLGAKDPVAKKFAVDLGIAMQLTNILRDVAEDGASGRQYIPQSWLTPTVDLRRPTEAISLLAKPAFKRLHELAEHYYKSAYVGLRYLPLRSRLSITIAARLYQDIGLQAKRQDFPVLNKRIVISSKRKCWLILISLIRFTSSLFWDTKPPPHNSMLHSELTPWLEAL